MPITQSAKKAHRQSERKRSRNNAVKRQMKDTIKEFQSLAESDTKKAQEMVSTVYKRIDKAAKKGVIKPNTAARKKSSMMRTLSQKNQ